MRRTHVMSKARYALGRVARVVVVVLTAACIAAVYGLVLTRGRPL